jgi:Phage integrase family
MARVQPLIPTRSTAEANDRASNGCESLLALLDPQVIAAPPNPALWQQMEPTTITWLVHTCAPFPWLNHLALAGIIYASSEMAQPALHIHALHRFLIWAIPSQYPDLASLQPEPALVAYFSDPPRARGLSACRAYTALQLHVERYLDLLTTEQRTALVPFLFPRLGSSVRLTNLTQHVQAQTRRTRKEKAFAITRHLAELVALARRRYRWLAEFEDKVQQAIQAVKQGEAELPVLIPLKDLEGQTELRFRLWDRLSWIRTHRAAYHASTLPQARKANTPAWFFLQLVGDLPQQHWFLRAMAQGALQGGDPAALLARQYRREWKIQDFSKTEPGLLNAGQGTARALAAARAVAAGTPADSRLLFRLEPLLAGAAVGLFVLVSIVSTGMRIGELQQVTLDRDCIEALELPEFDDQAGSWAKGLKRIYWRVYPKGRQQRERYLVTPYMTEALFILLDLHRRYCGENSFKSVRPNAKGFTHARRFPGQHKFVLQWGGRHLSQHTLLKCIQFLLLEHICRDQEGNVVEITPHLLRHAVAGWLRQKGIPLEEIMTLLKHVNLTVTDYYSQPSPEILHQKLGPALTALAELAGTDPAAIRSVEELQQVAQAALKRFGALRRIPGGYCGTMEPCMVHFACATCRFFVPDPTKRADVEAKLILSNQIITLRQEAGDYIEAENEQVHRREWERILKEMEALEQVQLNSPPAAAVLENLAGGAVISLFLPHAETSPYRLATEKRGDA